jgi:hypothetical protein
MCNQGNGCGGCKKEQDTDCEGHCGCSGEQHEAILIESLIDKDCLHCGSKLGDIQIVATGEIVGLGCATCGAAFNHDTMEFLGVLDKRET